MAKKQLPHILRQATTKRTSHKFLLPTYPPTSITRGVFLCIPNDVNFLIALQSWLASGEYTNNWEFDRSQDFGQFYQDWARMVSTMQSCDFEDITIQLTRVADSLESIEDKTPSLVSLQDILSNPQNYFANEILATIAPLLEIMSYITSFFPEIRVDPFKVVTWVTTMIRHTQVIAALMAIVAAIASLAAAQGTTSLVELITGGINSLFKMQEAFTNLRDDIIGAVTTFWSEPVDEIDANFDEIDYTLQWHSQNVILGDIADSLRHLNQQFGDMAKDSCLCMSQGGGIAQPAEETVVCEEPIPPYTWEGYLEYRRAATYYLSNTLYLYFTQFNRFAIGAMTLGLRWVDTLGETDESELQEPILSRLGRDIPLAIDETMNPYWNGNQTQLEKAGLQTDWYDYFIEFFGGLLGTDEEADVQGKVDDMFGSIFTEVISYIQTDNESNWTNIYNAKSSSLAHDTFQLDLQATIDKSDVSIMLSSEANTLFNSIASQGMSPWTLEGLYQPLSELTTSPAPPTWIDDQDMGCGV